jgi:hypothetical protein
MDVERDPHAAKLIGTADLQELAPPSGESGAALLRLRLATSLINWLRSNGVADIEDS